MVRRLLYFGYIIAILASTISIVAYVQEGYLLDIFQNSTLPRHGSHVMLDQHLMEYDILDQVFNGETSESNNHMTNHLKSNFHSEGDAYSVSTVEKKSSISPALGDAAASTRCIPPNHKDWVPPQLPPELVEVDQEDPRLIAHIRDCWLLPPSGKHRNLKEPRREDFSQHGQSPFLEEFFSSRLPEGGGFFIECGALDGEILSNTLALEMRHNWHGLLIEANPESSKKILKKSRNAYVLRTCLSSEPRPMELTYSLQGVRSGLADYTLTMKRYLNETNNQIQLQCLPLYSVLAALGQPRVDLVSLDVEGAEVSILKTLPLDKMDVGAFHIERGTSNRMTLLKSLMEANGFEQITVPFGDFDVFFVRE